MTWSIRIVHPMKSTRLQHKPKIYSGRTPVKNWNISCRPNCLGAALIMESRSFQEKGSMRVVSEFALSHSELNEISHHNALKMTKKAAKIVYQTKKYGSRGEFGEILLHIAIRQVYIKIPA